MSNIKQLIPPAVMPVSITEALDHLRLDDTTDAASIAAAIAAASEHLDGAAGFLGRSLITQTWALTLPGFAREIRIPLPPLQTATIAYLDLNGVSQTLDPATFSVDPDGYIRLAPDKVWPAVQRVWNAVTITYVAGYGDDWNAVPMPIRQAILILVEQLYNGMSIDVTAVKPMLFNYTEWGF